MRILRLEYKGHPKRGPWYIPAGFDYFDMAVFGTRLATGAYEADKMARKQGVKEPSDHPSPTKDKLITEKVHYLDDDHYFGFKDVAQYVEWFQTPEVRKAVLTNGRIVLVCYTVPDKYVIVGESQVIFNIKHVIEREELSEDFAINPT